MELNLLKLVLSGIQVLGIECLLRKQHLGGARIIKNAGFEEATFGDFTDFRGTTFGKYTYFGETIFGNITNFKNATFGDFMHFRGTTFAKNVRFIGTSFSENTYFREASFGVYADFREATFKSVFFLKTKFSTGSTFLSARFPDRCIFESVQFFELEEWNNFINFTKVEFGKPKKVKFDNTNLRFFLFSETNVKEIEFHNCNWLESQKIGRRKSVLDEKFLLTKNNIEARALEIVGSKVENLLFGSEEQQRETGISLPTTSNTAMGNLSIKKGPEDNEGEVTLEEEIENNKDLSYIADLIYSALKSEAKEVDEKYKLEAETDIINNIAQLYRRLQENFENNKRYDEAGDFYIGAMEMRRRKESVNRNPVWRWLRFNILGLVPWYRYTSLYGESYTRPVIWILLVLFIFPGFFLLAGFTFPDTVPNYFINYDLAFSLDMPQLIADWSKALLVSFYSFTFQRGGSFALSVAGKTLAVVQSMLSAILLALFLLAIKRRFRR